MGLFGPSWSWEELQRKDALMGELKKENDRVLDKQRKENDRILKEVNRSADLDPEILKYKAKSYSSEKWNFLTEFRSLIAANKFISSYFCTSNDPVSAIIMTIITIIAIPTLVMFFINIGAFIGGIILICAIYISCQTIRILWSLPNVLYNRNRIKNTKCYKEILSKVKDIGGTNIKNIYVSTTKVAIETIDNKKVIITYSSLNFPKLSLNKQSILLGTLIKDLKCSFYFSTELCNTGAYIEENPEHFDRICVRGYNKRVETCEHKKKDKEKKLMKKNIKNGETW